MKYLFLLIFNTVFSFFEKIEFFSEKVPHAFHISKTDMSFKPQDKTMQLTLHLFIDDIEMALTQQGHKKLFVGTERELPTTNDLLFKYLKSNFNLKINNKEVVYTWVGKETTSDKQALWVYMEIRNVKDIKNIAVENKILTEVFSDQKNIVQVNVPSKKQGYFLLDKSKVKDFASF
jgi:hypothetical protein